MMNRSLSILLSLGLYFLSFAILEHPAFSATSPTESACFDFSKAVQNPLKEILGPKKGNEVRASGKLAKPAKGVWGAARGKVNQPIQKLYEMLLNHYTIKDPKRLKLRVYPQEKQGFRDFHLVMVSLPTPVMTVRWEEEWGYVIAEGSDTAPQKIVISYQKTTGSKFVPRLCGSIVLRASGTNDTDVYLYEEVDAFGKRSPLDTLQGHLGTLATLRKGMMISGDP